MNRRNFLHQWGAAASLGSLGLLDSCNHNAKVNASGAMPAVPPASLPPYEKVPALAPIRATEDRIFRITVCLRPFRAAGPRLDVEKVGDKTVVHNYGHGGSGWSLSWGSGSVVVEKALAGGERDIAVLGCGALGLTSAILLQRAGARVTIYAKDRPPDVRSARATGSWTPDSRIAKTSVVSPDFAALWERMARYSFSMYQSFLGAPGNPIEWTDRYMVSDNPPAPGQGGRRSGTSSLGFAQYQSRIADITPRTIDLPAGTHPFEGRSVRRTTNLMFNVAGYARQLMSDFMIAGGKIETVEFHSPSELSTLSQKVIVNATGYGARSLWKDESIVPVRGQIAWLIPQPDVNYGISYKNVGILGRRDGIVVQSGGIGEADGFNNTNEQPDREEALNALQTLASLYYPKPVS